MYSHYIDTYTNIELKKAYCLQSNNLFFYNFEEMASKMWWCLPLDYAAPMVNGLHLNQRVDHTVKVIEEWQEVEGKLEPALLGSTR